MLLGGRSWSLLIMENEKMRETIKIFNEESSRKDELINYLTEGYNIEDNFTTCMLCNEWFAFEDNQRVKDEDEIVYMCENCRAVAIECGECVFSDSDSEEE